VHGLRQAPGSTPWRVHPFTQPWTNSLSKSLTLTGLLPVSPDARPPRKERPIKRPVRQHQRSRRRHALQRRQVGECVRLNPQQLHEHRVDRQRHGAPYHTTVTHRERRHEQAPSPPPAPPRPISLPAEVTVVRPGHAGDCPHLPAQPGLPYGLFAPWLLGS
jgi:hypothetical protein